MKNLLFFGFFLVINNIHSQEISHFNLTQDYNKAITYEVEGLSESDLILANAMFFNGRLNDDQKNSINNPYAYSKGDFYHPLNKYVYYISNSSEYQNCRTLDLVYQKPVTIDTKTIGVSLSEFGAWGGGYSSKDKLTYVLKINIENEKISLSIDAGQYARTIQLYTDTKTERRKTFDQMFNKKGEIKKLLNDDAKVIVEAINNSISIYFNFIECFKNKKAKIDSEFSIQFNRQLKEDKLEDSLAKIITIQDVPDAYLDAGCSYLLASFTEDNVKNKIQELCSEDKVSEAWDLIGKNSSSLVAFAGNYTDYLMSINESEVFFPEYSSDVNDRGEIEEIYEGDGYKVVIILNNIHEATSYDDIGLAMGTMTITNEFGGELKKEVFRICGN
mgnify:CR=1 FL=1